MSSNARDAGAGWLPELPEEVQPSSPGIRRLALEATRAAVQAAKDARKKSADTPTEESP